MPAMTMGVTIFSRKGLRPEASRDRRRPGHRNPEVVNGGELYVQDLRKTGHAPLAGGAQPVQDPADVMAPGDAVPD